ncbi:hypothetical protein MVEN_00603200 [Mycena venus]|uniref:BTB domain transcription factor n=1 Tax=Mycena venus TaxID=2733690 RepID=A0A8H6YK04_9AGAR|nr:hypothetical protein MVEN_00603200 [Mycena venus]
MVTTRRQEAQQEAADAPDNLTKRPAPENSALKPTSPIPESDDAEVDGKESPDGRKSDDPEPPTKKVKLETPEEEIARKDANSPREPGTTERGHIYFFFRPRVETDEPTSIDDVKNLHMLLVPRPPKFSAADDTQSAANTKEDSEMELLTQGSRRNPDSRRGGRKESFWATVMTVGDDLDTLEKGMGEKTYETKTRGTRHDPPARLVARGCYAIVNNDAQRPSQETTYLGYSLSHPAPSDFGPVQTALGIHRAGAFVLQVKNPEASGGLSTKKVVYPSAIMEGVFGKGTRGREVSGLRFAPCSKPQMLDCAGVELLLVAVRGGESGLEESLGEGRGEALTEAGEMDEVLSVSEIFRELWGGDEGQILPEALNGEWI